jgi:ABC-2 type transport system ATP-binding protein
MTIKNSVEVKNLSVQFGDFFAVKNITFDVKKGEIFGFLGANGAGKTTTIKVLCGVQRPTLGEVSVNGESYEDITALKGQIGYMSQKFTLYDDLTVYENFSFNSSLRKLDRSFFQKRIKELLDFIGFEYPLHALVADLPGGIKQQVSLVVSMLHDPEVIFLDEPTAGVTPYYRNKFWDLIRSLSKKGKTVFVTTHYMDEAEYCDRIALMRTGEIIALDTPKNLKKKVFPEKLVEISNLDKASNVIEELKKDKNILSLLPFGSRYHLILKDIAAHKEFQLKYSHLFNVKEIEPNLEDVFVRLVEGDR